MGEYRWPELLLDYSVNPFMTYCVAVRRMLSEGLTIASAECEARRIERGLFLSLTRVEHLCKHELWLGFGVENVSERIARPFRADVEAFGSMCVID